MDKRRGNIYYIINILFLLAAASIFALRYRNVRRIIGDLTPASLIVFAVMVFLVHVVKAARLFFTLYGNDISARRYIAMYCKVTSVNIVVPYKLGELFRMFCYGREIGSLLKGAIIILLDRFMDTAALLTVLILARILTGNRLTTFVFVFVAFLVFAVFVYYIFPGFAVFWKKYLLREKASVYKLWGLNVLQRLQFLYKEIQRVIQGKGIILFMLSCLAWILDIGSLLLSNQFGGGESYSLIMEYLMAVIADGKMLELDRFIVVSVIELALLYVIFRGFRKSTGKEVLR